MKKKIGEIYNKPIVIGDKNLMTKNEVHKDEISGGSKEYDDLHTYLYYDDRIVSLAGQEMPLCYLMTSMVLNMWTVYPHFNGILKFNKTTEDLGINLGNYLPINAIVVGSGNIEEILIKCNGVAIPKYILPENINMNVSGINRELDKMSIFDAAEAFIEKGFGKILNNFPTITREEFFDLLK